MCTPYSFIPDFIFLQRVAAGELDLLCVYSLFSKIKKGVLNGAASHPNFISHHTIVGMPWNWDDGCFFYSVLDLVSPIHLVLPKVSYSQLWYIAARHD